MSTKAGFLLVSVLASCLLLCSSQECGTSIYSDAGMCDREGFNCEGVTPRIVGGVDARRHELPYQVSLLWYDGFICGGFLWDELHVITAQHCTESDPANTFSVAVGEHIRSESDAENPERTIIEVEELIEHEDYDDYWLNDDIAILKLAEPVDLSDFRLPVCFSQDNAGDNTFGMDCCASGWGSESDDGPSTDQLKYATLPIIDFDECRNCDGFLPDEVKEGMICAGHCGQDNDKNTCYGDSGGPIAVKVENQMYVVGITSWGYGCTDPIPGVYTDIAYYEGWINDHING